jgi:PAS domain S-box-containing protein
MPEAPTIERLKILSRELDEQERAEILRREREVYLLLNALTDMVVVSNDAGIIRFANPATFRVLGYDPDDLLDTNICDILNCPELAHKVDTSCVTMAKTKSGDLIPIHMYIGSMKESNIQLIISIIRRAPHDTSSSTKG